MEKINSIGYIKVYNLYRCFAGHGNENNSGIGAMSSDILPLWYYCADCGTTFMVKHKRRSTGPYMYGYGEESVTCPGCNTASLDMERFARQIAFCVNMSDFEGNAYCRDFSQEAAPYMAKLDLYSMQNGVKLVATFRTIKLSLTDDKMDVKAHFDNRTETFLFDVKNRKTTLKVDGCSPVEIGQPMKWDALMKESMLRHLAANVLVTREDGYKPNGFVSLLKDMTGQMRKAVQAKWLEIHGYPLKRISTQANMYASGGLFLRQIHNIAFRMVYTDLPAFRLGENGLSTIFGGLNEAINDFDVARKSRNSISYIIERMELPNKPSVRRIVAKNIFAAPELKMALLVTDNFDCNMAIYETLNSTIERSYKGRMAFKEEMNESQRLRAYAFLKKIAPMYKPSSIRRFVVNIENFSYLEDIVNLAHDVEADKFTAPLSKMHDVLVEIQNRRAAQRELKQKLMYARASRLEKKMAELRSCDAFALNVPEAVKKRLIMQLESGRFFLPETNKDLDYTSDIMHNCVRTYDARIYSQRCNIVYYTDDNGKLLACIEVKGDKIVQAKLSYNKPVRGNIEVNKAIVEWAKAKELEIATYDICAEEQEKAVTAA